MPPIFVKKLIDNYPVSQLIFTGGEPFLRFDLIQYAVEYTKAKRKNISFVLQTNGTIFDQEKINYIKKNAMIVQISIDGTKKSHDNHRKFFDQEGSYNHIFNNIERLKKSKVRFYLSWTVTPDNVVGLSRNLVNFLKYYTVDLGFVFNKKPISKKISDLYIWEVGRFLKAYLRTRMFLEVNKIFPFENWFRDVLFVDGREGRELREAFRIKCRYGRIRLLPTGEFYPCIIAYSWIPERFKKLSCLGNINSLDFNKIKYFRDDFNLSQWTRDKRLSDCNRICYLHCDKPANKYNFDIRLANEVKNIFVNFVKKIEEEEREYYKKVINQKLKLLSKAKVSNMP